MKVVMMRPPHLLSLTVGWGILHYIHHIVVLWFLQVLLNKWHFNDCLQHVCPSLLKWQILSVRNLQFYWFKTSVSYFHNSLPFLICNKNFTTLKISSFHSDSSAFFFFILWNYPSHIFNSEIEYLDNPNICHVFTIIPFYASIKSSNSYVFEIVRWCSWWGRTLSLCKLYQWWKNVDTFQTHISLVNLGELVCFIKWNIFESIELEMQNSALIFERILTLGTFFIHILLLNLSYFSSFLIWNLNLKLITEVNLE